MSTECSSYFSAFAALDAANFLSARAYHRTLKLARTIADLADSAEIDTPHVAEALTYRPRQRP